MSDCNGCGGVPPLITDRTIMMEQITIIGKTMLSEEHPKVYICEEWEFKDRFVACYPEDERVKNGIFSHYKTLLL